jgi:peptidoglycan/LPS O-acetylase OafA/YrhL
MNRHNNFDLLRLLAAAGIMAQHIADLSAERALQVLTRADAKLALSTFFVISGYLVFMSCAQTSSLPQYAAKRARRVVPAYVAVVLLCAVLGVTVSVLPWRDYIGPGLWRYLAANLSFLNFLAPSLPGVFVDNPFPGAPVNGALWTIKVELMFYAVVPLFVWLCRRWGHHLVLGLGFLLACLWWGACVHLAWRTGKAGFFELAKQMPGQLMFFLPGAWCWYERARLLRWGHAVGVVGLLLLVLAYQWDQTHVTPGVFLYPLGLALLVSWAAQTAPYAGHVTRHGDLSYGIYIVHFPVLQALVHFGVFRAAPWFGVGLAVVCVVVLAWLSWHLIEAPSLHRGSGTRRALAASRG